MKTPTLLKNFIFCATALVAASNASAADGTITFSGTVTANTCTILVDDGALASNAKAITLPTPGISALYGTVGNTFGKTAFKFNLTGCGAAISPSTGWIYLSGAVLSGTSALFTSGTATGIGIQILNSGGSPLSLSTTPAKASDAYTLAAGASTNQTFYYQYISTTAAATAGSIVATLVADIYYN